jgi:uncharacterized protein (DUF2236 family)
MPRGMSDAGLFGPDSLTWRVNREGALLLGGGRALLLQVAHPLVAAGVAQHSNYREDPFGRLYRTLDTVTTIVFGSTTEAEDAAARLHRVHTRVKGDADDGTPYVATDPKLVMWVHATLVDTTIAANDAWIEPLQRERRARFYAETLPIGRAFGVPPNLLPPTLEAFEAYVSSMLAPGGPIRVSPAARELADAIMHPPLGPIVPALAGLPPRLYAWSFWPSIGLLPASVRDDYGFRWGALERAVSAWLVAGWRGWRPIFPAWLRQVPQALAADRRVGRSP